MARYLTLALKRQKMTQLWSLLAAEPFNLDDRIIAYPTISFILRTMASVSFPNFEQNSSNKSARFGPIEKFGRPSDRKLKSETNVLRQADTPKGFLSTLKILASFLIRFWRY